MADDGPSAHELARARLRAIQRRAALIEDPDRRAELEQGVRDMLVEVARLERDRPDAPSRLHWRTWVGPPDDREAYLVVRWFMLDGDRAEPGEIIAPTRGFWLGRHPPTGLIGMGALVLLDRPEVSWECDHRRFWISREAWLSHGCSEPPADEAEADLPATTRANFARVYPRAYRQLCDDLGHRPKRREVADKLSISVSTMRRYRLAAGLVWPPE